jgi:hypothetical protein
VVVVVLGVVVLGVVVLVVLVVLGVVVLGVVVLGVVVLGVVVLVVLVVLLLVVVVVVLPVVVVVRVLLLVVVVVVVEVEAYVSIFSKRFSCDCVGVGGLLLRCGWIGDVCETILFRYTEGGTLRATCRYNWYTHFVAILLPRCSLERTILRPSSGLASLSQCLCILFPTHPR